MTDAGINEQLGRAIGWLSFRIHPDGTVYVREETLDALWRRFDYHNPTVIWPIAERYDAFPMRLASSLGTVWFAHCVTPKGDVMETASSTNPAKAVALAVIEAHRK